MLSRLKEMSPTLSSRKRGGDKEDGRRGSVRSLLRKGRSLLPPTEGRDDGDYDEASKPVLNSSFKKRNGSLHGSIDGNVSESSAGKKQLEDFVKLSEPESPTDVMDFHGIESVSSIDGLREIAKDLAQDKPRALTTQEQQQLEHMGRRITLGDSVRDSVSSRKVLKKVNNKARSLGPDDLGGVVDQVNDKADRVRMDSSKNTNSPRSRHRKFLSETASSLLVTPSLEKSSTHAAEPPAIETKLQSFKVRLSPTRRASAKQIPKEDIDELAIPSLAPCQGFLTPTDNLVMRTSELNPLPHQVEIPPSSEVLIHSRLCHVLDHYHTVDQNFDFGVLKGMARTELEEFKEGDSPKGMVRLHWPIAHGLLRCPKDLVLEAYLHEDSNEINKRVEVAIFNSQTLRQFIVVYRGTSDQQSKPVRSKQTRVSPVNLHDDQQVGVFPSFQEVYFRSKLEAQVFGILDRLSNKHHFCDVVMTGHSFGAALATIAALRFSISREMIRVSCHVFGSPKVGASSFRQLVNSLPNLKVIRIEHESDQVVNAPDSGAWTHVGHTVSVDPDRKPIAIAYRFEKRKPVAKHVLGPRKVEKSLDVKSYVNVMEQCSNLRKMWARRYLGEKIGNGVRGEDNELREVV